MTNTIIGVFDDRAEAQRTEQDLINAGFDRSAISVRATEGQHATGTATKPGRDDGGGIWEAIKDLFGMADEGERAYYQEAARRGGVILAVTAPENQIDRACDIIERHHPVDIETRAQQWRQQGWTPPATLHRSGDVQARLTTQQHQQPSQQQRQPQQRQTTQRQTGDEAIPVVQEELRVGKRAVNRGGVRVYSHVTERPVEENVQLREERVHVERRPVDRPLTAADDAFRERAIEARETAEEAVVQKQARVVEEVTVNKDVQQRTEKVRDTVRRTDVDVERLDEHDERFRPAYDFATELAADQRYRGRSWSEIEPEARRSFEQRHPGSTWEQMKDAVRRGWEGTTTSSPSSSRGGGRARK
jgi:uncharacterized protein (TIGR02271 family)